MAQRTVKLPLCTTVNLAPGASWSARVKLQPNSYAAQAWLLVKTAFPEQMALDQLLTAMVAPYDAEDDTIYGDGGGIDIDLSEQDGGYNTAVILSQLDVDNQATITNNTAQAVTITATLRYVEVTYGSAITVLD